MQKQSFEKAVDNDEEEYRTADFVTPSPVRQTYFDVEQVDLDAYDHVILNLSGKDSIAALLKLIEDGVDLARCEIWHHLVDGIGGDIFMDWPCMDDYMVKFAQAFNLPLYFSSLEHGFKGEMLKNNSVAHDHLIETPDGMLRLGRTGKPGTRLKYPQKSKSLSVRWCSAVLKVDIGRRALTNQDRFLGKKVLYVTGERRSEGGGRKYYLLCIFSSPATWATLHKYWPERVHSVQHYEHQLDCTISRNRIDVVDVGAQSNSWIIEDKEALVQSTRKEYELPIFTPKGQKWKLPQGAFSNEEGGAS